MAVTQIDGARQIRFTGNLDLETNRIINVVDPSGAQDVATKGYVDSQVAGGVVDFKESVRVATTANGALATAFENGLTVDGVTLATNDRILLKNQSTGSENGIYTVEASGAPTRATDVDDGSEVTSSMFVFVEEGTVNADSGWSLTNTGAITVGSTSLVFERFAGAGDSHISDMTAGQGLSKSTDLIDVELTSSGGLQFTGAAPNGTLGLNLDADSGLALGAGGISVGDGSGLVASGGTLSVDLETNGGLQFDTGVKIELTTNSGLGLTGTGLEIGDGSGLTATGGSLAVDLEAAGVGTGGLAFDAGEIRVLLATNSGMALTATGLEIGDGSGLAATAGVLAVDLDTTSGLEFVTGSLGVNVSNGLQRDSAGVSVGEPTNQTISTDATSVSVQFDGATLDSTGAGVKLADGTAGHVLVGQGLGSRTNYVAVSGDATISSAGALAIQTSYITSSWVTRESPTGLVDGTNTDYTLANGVLSNTEEVFLNGILQNEGGSNDYTMADSTTVGFIAAPEVSDVIVVNYAIS